MAKLGLSGFLIVVAGFVLVHALPSSESRGQAKVLKEGDDEIELVAEVVDGHVALGVLGPTRQPKECVGLGHKHTGGCYDTLVSFTTFPGPATWFTTNRLSHFSFGQHRFLSTPKQLVDFVVKDETAKAHQEGVMALLFARPHDPDG